MKIVFGLDASDTELQMFQELLDSTAKIHPDNERLISLLEASTKAKKVAIGLEEELKAELEFSQRELERLRIDRQIIQGGILKTYVGDLYPFILSANNTYNDKKA